MLYLTPRFYKRRYVGLDCAIAQPRPPTPAHTREPCPGKRLKLALETQLMPIQDKPPMRRPPIEHRKWNQQRETDATWWLTNGS